MAFTTEQLTMIKGLLGQVKVSAGTEGARELFEKLDGIAKECDRQLKGEKDIEGKKDGQVVQ